jgi:excisionase family DNA binding protein
MPPIGSVEQAAVYLGISTRNFRQKVKDKLFPSVRIGGRILIRKASLDKTLARLEVQSL